MGVWPSRKQYCYMFCEGFAEYSFENFTAHIEELLRFTASSFDFDSKLQSEIPAGLLQLDYDVHSSNQSSNCVSMPSNASIILTQCTVHGTIRNFSPHRLDVIQLERSFLEKGIITHKGDSGKPETNKCTSQEVKKQFYKDSSLSIFTASRRQHLSPTTAHCILRKCLISFFYKFQNIQSLEKG